MENANPFSGTRIELHILQSFPPVNLNRDESGQPKMATVGGTQRARVSSQAWKRAIRIFLEKLGVPADIRSKGKNLKPMLMDRMIKAGASEEQADSCAEKIIGFFNFSDTLALFSTIELNGMIDFARSRDWDLAGLPVGKKKNESGGESGVDDESAPDESVTKNGGRGKGRKPAEKVDKALVKAFLESFTKKLGLNEEGQLNGLSVALFGRMMASRPECDIEAAASFAHSITTHECHSQIDYFSAIDDFAEKGAGHIDNAEFVSGTFYRYISIDLGLLWENLNGLGVPEAIDFFLKSAFAAIPGGKKTSWNGSRVWDYARVLVRKGQNMQASFQQPVKMDKGGGYLENSVAQLNASLEKNAKVCKGTDLYGRLKDYVFGAGDDLARELRKKGVEPVENIGALCGRLGDFLKGGLE